MATSPFPSRAAILKQAKIQRDQLATRARITKQCVERLQAVVDDQQVPLEEVMRAVADAQLIQFRGHLKETEDAFLELDEKIRAEESPIAQPTIGLR